MMTAPLARKPMSNAEYLLAEIRLARAHASLWLNTIDTLGVALKAHLITPEQALAELRECGFFHPLVDRPSVAEVGTENAVERTVKSPGTHNPRPYLVDRGVLLP